MNKKYAIVSIVLIALMALALIPTGIKAFVSPTGTDNQKFQEFGPAASELLIKIYTSYTTELVGFEGKQVDIMDWPLDPADYNYLRSTDPSNLTYTEAFNSEFSLYEWDLCDWVMPTNLTAFRIGLSWIMNKDFFINYYSGLEGAATKADSPIASCTGYYDPAVTNLYEAGHPRTTLTPYPDDDTDMLNAYNSFVAALGAPVPDDGSANSATGSVSGNMMFTWQSPFTTPSVLDGIPAIGNGHLLVFARSSSPARAAQGLYLQTLLEQSLPNWCAAHSLPAVHIYVDLYTVSRSVAFDQAMSAGGANEYRYNVYTGGWSLSRDPTFLQYYTTQYTPQRDGMAPEAHNYGGYTDSIFDSDVAGLLATPAPGGNPSTPGTATYWAYAAQAEMMGAGWSPTTGAALIPGWYTTGYFACLSSLHNVVNTVGFGINGWNTMLNAYDSSGQIVYGYQSDWSTGNPITAPWVWDWDVLGEIYDSLISVNPYNMGQDRPYIAQNWTYGSWTTSGTPWVAGGTYTTITFTLRQDVYWQDVPLKDRSAYTWNMSNVDNGPFVGYPLTPVDVAFSILSVRDLDTFDTTENGILVDPYSGLGVDHVAMSPVYQSAWPYTTSIPQWFNTTAIDNIYGAQYPNGSPLTWQYNSVVFNSALAPNQITVYLTSPSTWIGLHAVGGLPILPYHIWRNLPLDSWSYNGHALLGMGWIDASPSGADITYGTGPYILTSHVAGTSFTLIPYTYGATYGSTPITETHCYFWNSPIRTQDISPGPGPASTPGTQQQVYWKQGTNSLWYSPGTLVNRDNTSSYTFTVQAYYDYDAYYGGTWHNSVAGMTQFPTTQTLTLAAGAEVTPWFGSGALTFPTGTTYIDVSVNYKITITAGPAGTIGRISEGGDFGYGGSIMLGYNTYTYGAYSSRITEMFNVGHYAERADVAGAAIVEPYYGSQYKVSTAALTILAQNWGKSGILWTGNINPTDAVHRADIMGAGKISTADLTALAQCWGKTWTDSPPADPASPYLTS